MHGEFDAGSLLLLFRGCGGEGRVAPSPSFPCGVRFLWSWRYRSSPTPPTKATNTATPHDGDSSRRVSRILVQIDHASCHDTALSSRVSADSGLQPVTFVSVAAVPRGGPRWARTPRRALARTSTCSVHDDDVKGAVPT